MARKGANSKSENVAAKVTEKVQAVKEDGIVAKGQVEKTEDEHVDKLMRLYPYLESMWITPQGFVHPEGVPEHLRKNAKLYKNKYYNK